MAEKSITFKKKDKDNFIVEAIGIECSTNKLYIWEVLMSNGQSRLVQITENIG